MTHQRAVDWLAEFAPGGEVAFRIGRSGDDVVAEWLGIVRLVARRDGSHARMEPAEGARQRDVDRVTNGSAVLLLRELRGQVALHGAAVGLGENAVVLLGRSGMGKSTLAAALCRDPRVTLLADDAVALDRSVEGGWAISPIDRHHWLDADAVAALDATPLDTISVKAPVVPPRLGAKTTRVVGFLDLTWIETGKARVTRIRGVDAMCALVPQAVRFILDEPARQRRELEVLASIVESIPIYRLERVRRLDDASLGETTGLVIDLLLSPRSTSAVTQEQVSP